MTRHEAIILYFICTPFYPAGGGIVTVCGGKDGTVSGPCPTVVGTVVTSWPEPCVVPGETGDATVVSVVGWPLCATDRHTVWFYR